MWLERLKGSGLWIEKWIRHQRRDAYWKHGSICENYADIEVPVFTISGWADGYSNAVFRLLSNLKVPCKGLIGPWSHKYPHLGIPGPAIGFLQESLRWWDKWLKGIETGVMDEPRLRVWMQDSVAPTTRYAYRPGRWVAEQSWPSPDILNRKMLLGPGTLVEEGEEVSPLPLTVQSPLTVGLFAGKWCSYAAGPDLAHDQRQEDGGALVFETQPLTERMEILGAPVVELEVASDKPVAMIAARLCDIAPDDKATRVTYGLLNLTHRENREFPEPLEPGRRYRVHLPLNHIAQVFPAGHRLRLSLSTSYWPMAWPPPEPVRVTIFSGSSSLTIPVRPPRNEDDSLSPFLEPESASESPQTMIKIEHHNWWVHRNLATDESTLEVVNDMGAYFLEDIGLEVRTCALEWYSSRGDDFDSIRGETRWERSFRRGEWYVRTVTRTVLTSTSHDFCIQADLDAYEGEKRIYSRSWDTVIPRDNV
jgi:predicted acyl esterase